MPSTTPIYPDATQAVIAQLVDAVGIAELAGVSRSTVDSWRHRDLGFPKPVRIFGNVPVYWRADVVAWLEETGRREA